MTTRIANRMIAPMNKLKTHETLYVSYLCVILPLYFLYVSFVNDLLSPILFVYRAGNALRGHHDDFIFAWLWAYFFWALHILASFVLGILYIKGKHREQRKKILGISAILTFVGIFFRFIRPAWLSDSGDLMTVMGIMALAVFIGNLVIYLTFFILFKKREPTRPEQSPQDANPLPLDLK